jgi:hypothetical protein
VPPRETAASLRSQRAPLRRKIPDVKPRLRWDATNAYKRRASAENSRVRTLKYHGILFTVNSVKWGSCEVRNEDKILFMF